MNLNVVLSCDENPYYADFWPLVKDIWKRRFDIEPQLVYINNEKETTSFEEGILYIKQLDDVPVHLQAQMARIYFTHLFPDEVCLISDIDMFPVSKSFFSKEDILKVCKKDSFLHLNPEEREFGQLPICYYAGYGTLYKKLLEEMTWPEFIRSIVHRDFNTDKFSFSLPPHLEGKKLWFSDELFLYSQINARRIPIISTNKVIGPARLDRKHIIGVDFFSLMGQCVDVHLPRPYTKYKTSIDNIYHSLIL